MKQMKQVTVALINIRQSDYRQHVQGLYCSFKIPASFHPYEHLVYGNQNAEVIPQKGGKGPKTKQSTKKNDPRLSRVPRKTKECINHHIMQHSRHRWEHASNQEHFPGNTSEKPIAYSSTRLKQSAHDADTEGNNYGEMAQKTRY